MMSTEQQSAEPIIEIVNLSKVFKDFWGRPKAKAVNEISFTVHRGEVFGLLGPNGSGKSTTIKMILGLLYPTGGGIRVCGSMPTDFRVKRKIGYLPEESYMYNYLTAEEILMYFGSFFNLSKEECYRRTQQLLEMVGLKHAAHRRVGEYSKGMLRRIGLAQALINDPELVILDEPTAGLDPIGCHEIKEIIKVLAKRGKTVVLCSHLLSDVEDVCDKAVIMYGGKIKASGKLEELLQTPQDVQINVGELKERDLHDLQVWLTERGYGETTRVSAAKTRLEDYFLQIVGKAKQGQNETAGAQQGGEVAEYLKSDTSESINQRLATLLSAEESGTQQTDSQEETPEIKIDVGALEKLSKVHSGTETIAKEAETSAEEERRKSNEKLEKLLSGK